MFFTPSLQIGGIEKVFATYANYLAISGYKVYYVFGNDHFDYSLFNSYVVKISLGNIRLRASLWRLMKNVIKYSPDVLVTGGDYPNIYCIISSLLTFKRSKILISHHSYFNVEVNHTLSRILIKYFYNMADGVLSVSNGITAHLESLGVRKSLCTTIYNPVDINYVINSSNEPCNNLDHPYIIFVGRLSKVKNLKLLIDAFGILRERLKDTNLVIVGDGEEKEDLVNYVESLGLDKEILFTGPLANPYSLMAKSMLITLTSISEALPTVIIEAFALGKTVVSTPTCGAIDLLSGGEYGYLTKRFDNPIEFAELMEKAVALPIDQKKLVDRANFFAVENQSTELIHLLNHL